MSRCDWRTTTGARSRPDEAGTETTTFPSGVDARLERPLAAHASTCSRAGPSAFDGRAIRVSSEKRSQRSARLEPSSASLTAGA